MLKISKDYFTCQILQKQHVLHDCVDGLNQIISDSDSKPEQHCNIYSKLAKVARTLLGHFEGLLTYFKHRVTNAKTEGINNKIKTLKRQAYGYRDMEYFKLRLYHLHKQETSLVG